MFCEGDISFQLYKNESQVYLPAITNEIIGEIDVIDSLRQVEYAAGNGVNYEFILPQKGKNIQYCEEQKCVDLIWQDGSFSMAKE
ncbi:MAG: hypothetical protein AAFX57_13430 [Bacteroidota bacterium]